MESQPAEISEEEIEQFATQYGFSKWFVDLSRTNLLELLKEHYPPSVVSVTDVIEFVH